MLSVPLRALAAPQTPLYQLLSLPLGFPPDYSGKATSRLPLENHYSKSLCMAVFNG